MSDSNLCLSNPDEIISALYGLAKYFENIEDEFGKEVKDANEAEQFLKKTTKMAQNKQESLTDQLNGYKARYQNLDEKRQTLDVEMRIVQVQKTLDDIDEMLNTLKSYDKSIQDIIQTTSQINKQSKDLNKDMFLLINRTIALIQHYTKTY